jgi:hypothetical protein
MQDNFLPISNGIMRRLIEGKQMTSKSCTIYLLRNHINDKLYVGQTWDSTEARMARGYKNSHHINAAINKYGKLNFYYETLSLCSDQNVADYLEDCYITLFDSTNREKGYNLKKGGNHGRHSAETKAKMSASAMGKKGTRNGVKQSAETIAKRIATRRTNNTYQHTDETKKKISLNSQGNKYALGYKHTAEAKKKMSNSRKGRKVSDATRLKLSITSKAYWERKKLQQMNNTNITTQENY